MEGGGWLYFTGGFLNIQPNSKICIICKYKKDVFYYLMLFFCSPKKFTSRRKVFHHKFGVVAVREVVVAVVRGRPYI